MGDKQELVSLLTHHPSPITHHFLMFEPKSFLYEVHDSVGWITLNRPERLNALTFEVYRELTDMFAALRSEDEVRAVVITGAGRAFCSGGDVHDIIGELFQRDMQGLLEFTRLTCELVRNIRALPKPVIACLNGTTAGAGACIALASDIRLAAPSAKIAFLFVRVGLSGADMGAAYLLPRLVGLAKATELLYTGDFISAEEAAQIGLYNRVVAADELLNETRELAGRLAAGPAFALMMTKELLNRELDVSLETALEWEAQAQATCMQHPDYREAYEAFVEKREPKFKK
jgi:enoyl-CoA hydratase/carnithine racemase